MNPNDPDHDPTSTPGLVTPETPNVTTEQPPVPSMPEGSAQPQQPLSPLPPATPGFEHTPTASAQHSPKNKKLLIMLIVALLLIAVAGGVYALTQSKKSAPAAQQTAAKPAVVTPPEPNSIQIKEQDTERTTDIKALHGQIEAYYAQFGYYPTFANMNDKVFRMANLKGLDEEALIDPQNTETTLVRIPAPHVYAYQVAADDGAACDNIKKDCTKYTLVATLSDGKTFVKQSLN